MKIKSSHRRVAAADHGHLLALEEGAVADAAGGHATARELHLARDAEPSRLAPHGENDALRGVLLIPMKTRCTPPSLSSTQSASSVTNQVPKRSAWARNSFIISGPMVLGVAGMVLDVGGVLKLPAPLQPSITSGSRLARDA